MRQGVARDAGDGVLTVGTDYPTYEPRFVDDDPTDGEGDESAVAYAIAEQLGYAADEIEWGVVPFNAVVSPGEKKFDLGFTRDVADTVCFLHDGVIHETGSPEQVIGDPREERTRAFLSRLRLV